jgi:nitrogen regulatory protein PII
VKLIRCIVPPAQIDELLDALDPIDIVNLTVTAGGERSRGGKTTVYRGCEYRVRMVPTSVFDITACDDAVDDIVRTVTDVCRIGPDVNDGRILVVPVEAWYTIRATRRIA